mmetsp:Transcript_570/g.1606  ORF Transcript_570/g.1606 Transcript_570/m.1606 type:complete len:251 (+) Transcript_570:44-796(+)
MPSGPSDVHDPLAGVVNDMRSKMPQRAAAPAAVPRHGAAPSFAGGGHTAPESNAHKKFDPTRAFVAGAKLDAFKQRHAQLKLKVDERVADIAREFQALKRMQLEVGALHGPQKQSVEEMRVHLSQLSREVDATRQAYEAARDTAASAEERVSELQNMKAALVDRLNEIVSQNEQAKVAKLEELLGNLEHLDDDDLGSAEAALKAASAAAAAVKRGGTASSSQAREPPSSIQSANDRRSEKEDVSAAFDGF